MRIFQVDAFTQDRFAGNPATVILDADGQDDAALQAIAREFPHAEAAFVLASSAADHDLAIRFFNARKESPFVGHATVAAHAVLLALGRRGLGVCRQRSGTGILEVSAYERSGGGDAQPTIEFRQSAPELADPLPFKSTLRIAEALGLPGARLHESLPARIALKGSARLLVPVADARALDELKPHFDTLISLSAEFGAEGFFVFAYQRGAAGLTTDSRMFCPAIGIPEDPVSGNGHAMIAAYLFELGQLGRTATSFVGRQGSQLGRPGTVYVKIDQAEGDLIAVVIGGNAVIVTEGTLAR